MLPGPSVLERLIIRVCSTAHLALFESIYQHLSPELRDVIEAFLKPPEGEQRSTFYELKAYPPSASISSLQHYLKRYAMLSEAHLEQFQSQPCVSTSASSSSFRSPPSGAAMTCSRRFDLIRKLDSGELKHLPANAPTEFVPMELRRALKDRFG